MPKPLNVGDNKYTAENAAAASTAIATGTSATVLFNVSASPAAGTAAGLAIVPKTNSDNRAKIIFKGQEYPSITYNGMIYLPDDILSMIFGNIYELNKSEYKKLCGLFEKRPESNFDTVKIGLTVKDLASLSVTCSFFYRYIGGDRHLQSEKILPFALTKVKDFQHRHLSGPILEKAIMKGEVTVGKAISNTNPSRIKNFRSGATSWNGRYMNHREKAMILGYQPFQIRESWFSNEHYELLKQHQELQVELTNAKNELDNLIKQNNELKAIASHNKKQRAETPKIIQKLQQAEKSLFELRKMGENVSDNFKKTEQERLTKEIEECQTFCEKMKKMDAEPKEQAERDKKEKEANEKYAKLEQDFKEFEQVFAYEKIKGLKELQVKALRAGLLVTQLQNITETHIMMLEYWKTQKYTAKEIQNLFEKYKNLTKLQAQALQAGLLPSQLENITETHVLILEYWKAEKRSAEEIQTLFEKYKNFNVLQLQGLKAGFSVEQVSQPWFSQISLDGLMSGFSRQDVAQSWFSKAHITLAESGYTVEELRGLPEDKAKVLRYGHDRKTLLDIKTKIEEHHLKALQEGCSLIDVLDLDSQQCEVLIEGQKLGFNAKKLFDRKDKVELFHLETVKKGYELEEVIPLKNAQCEIMITLKLWPKDMAGLDAIAMLSGRGIVQAIHYIQHFKIHPKDWNELSSKCITSPNGYFDFNILFKKCSFEQAKKLNYEMLFALSHHSQFLTYEDVTKPNFSRIYNSVYMRNIIFGGGMDEREFQFKDIADLDSDSWCLLQRHPHRCTLAEVLQMDKGQRSILRQTEMSVAEYQRLQKIAQEHKLNSEQLIAMSPQYNLTLEQVKIPNFSLELAKAVQRGAKFDEARELNETQLKLFNYCNDTYKSLEKHITIQQAKQPWITPLSQVAMQAGYTYKEIEGLNGPQLLALLAGHSKEEALSNPQLSNPSPLFFSEAHRKLQDQLAQQQSVPKQASTEGVNGGIAATAAAAASAVLASKPGTTAALK